MPKKAKRKGDGGVSREEITGRKALQSREELTGRRAKQSREEITGRRTKMSREELSIEQSTPSKKKKGKPSNTDMSKERLSREEFTLQSTTETKTDTTDAAELNEISQNLTQYQWYHGMMPREEIEELLKNSGDFLLRKTDVKKRSRIALSFRYGARIRHVLLTHDNEGWTIRNISRPTVGEIVEYHYKNKIQVQSDGAIITNPVTRPEFYLLHDHIVIGKRLGGGAFGDVHKGVLKKGPHDEMAVAIKKFKGTMKKKMRREFVKEASIMRRFNHPNVIKVVGIAPNDEPILILLELCPGGSLHTYLKKNPQTPAEKLVSFSKGACRGLCYLSQRKVIHRDVAARNCLLGDHDEVKISDFGLSVTTNELKLNKLNKMPIKWLSPETLREGRFTTKSDVWSFGVMLWEIFSFCQTDPFPGLTNRQAKAKILSDGLPMEAPPGMPVGISIAMDMCFNRDVDARPTFDLVFSSICPNEVPPAPENDDFLKEIEKFKREGDDGSKQSFPMTTE